MEEYNAGIVAVIKMIVENNSGCVARKLRAVGYISKYDKIPTLELEAQLLKVYMGQEELFFDIMRQCEWNYGNNNWTNNPIIRDQILSAVEEHTKTKVDKTNWWPIAINHLQKNK